MSKEIFVVSRDIFLLLLLHLGGGVGGGSVYIKWVEEKMLLNIHSYLEQPPTGVFGSKCQ